MALAANLSVTFSEPVTVSANAFTLSCAVSGLHSLAVTGGPATFTLGAGSQFDSRSFPSESGCR